MKFSVALGVLYTSLLLANLVLPVVAKRDDDDGWGVSGILAGAAVGVGVVAAAPVVLTAAGFTSAGIAAGSYATGMMSAAAAANGGAVAAGSTVAVLQSVGAAGLAAGTKAAIVGAGIAAGAAVDGYKKKKEKECKP